MILRGSGMALSRRRIGVEVYAGMSNIYVLVVLFETAALERALLRLSRRASCYCGMCSLSQTQNTMNTH